jgi:hypothetical protein
MFLKCVFVSIFQISVCLFGCDHPVTLPTIPPLTLPAFVKARKPLTRWCAQLPFHNFQTNEAKVIEF